MHDISISMVSIISAVILEARKGWNMELWFVLYCKNGKDACAEMNLIKQDYTVYRPTVNVAKKTKKNGKKIKTESLFSRYLFVKVDPTKKSLFPATYTCGVSGFVKFGIQYATVTDESINEIKRCELLQRDKSIKNQEMTKGDIVYLNGDGFSEVKASFLESCGEKRVMVLLKMLGRMSEISVPCDSISKKSAY